MLRTIIIERWTGSWRLLPTDLYLWVKVLLLTGVAIQLARLVWVSVTPIGPLGDWRPASARILPQPVQMAILAAVDPFYRGASAIADQPVADTLEVTLHGVRGEGGLGGGAAIIALADGVQKSFAVGEEIAPGVTLAAVHFDHVLLDRGGGRQQKLLLVPDQASAGVAAASPMDAVAAPVGSSQSLSAAALRQAISFSPRNRDGRVTGVTVAPGSNPALFASAGFRAGDVVVAVNGARITSATDIAQLQSGILPGARLLLTVERGAETVPIALNIPGGS